MSIKSSFGDEKVVLQVNFKGSFEKIFRNNPHRKDYSRMIRSNSCWSQINLCQVGSWLWCLNFLYLIIFSFVELAKTFHFFAFGNAHKTFFFYFTTQKIFNHTTHFGRSTLLNFSKIYWFLQNFKFFKKVSSVDPLLYLTEMWQEKLNKVWKEILIQKNNESGHTVMRT